MIVLRRRTPRLAISAAVIAIMLLLAIGLAAGWAHEQGISLATTAGRVLAPVVDWPAQAALVTAVVVHLLVRPRLHSISMQLRVGWWAAIPLDPRSRTAALWLVAGTLAAICLAVSTAAVGALGMLAHDAAMGTALTIVAVGVVVGTASALLIVLRRQRVQRAPRIGVRRTLFGIGWLDDPRLPHLSDWQRREVLLRWRTQASATPVLAALLLLPSGVGPLTLLGLLLFALSACWLGLVLRTSIEVTAAAARLLHSTPTSARQRARVALRYPVFACVCASAGGLTVALAAGSWRLLLGWLALVGLLLVPAVPVAWRMLIHAGKQRQ
ncbi:MAG: hypothetical protein ACREPV_10235 [Lysobacter sp.]